jgi:hypothetical protein
VCFEGSPSYDYYDKEEHKFFLVTILCHEPKGFLSLIVVIHPDPDNGSEEEDWCECGMFSRNDVACS